MHGSKIIGLGTHLPEKVVTNDDLAAILDTSDEWIRERTGIRERRFGGTTVGMGVDAARKALADADVDAETLDLIVLATTSPDQHMPAGACSIQDDLGAPCAAFDMNAACSGFVYGLVIAHNFINGGAERVLVVGSEALDKHIDWSDRSTAVLFADGAGAAVVERTDDSALLGWHLGSHGQFRHLLKTELGGFIEMEGREVFRQAVLAVEASARASLANAGLTVADIDLVAPHQANIRIIEAACKRLEIPMEKAVNVLEYTGNTSSASIPLALDDARRNDRLHSGDTVLMVGFGAGMTSASAILRWTA